MEMLYIFLFKLACVCTSVAWNVSEKYANSEMFLISCEMNNVVEFLMCAEDEVHVAGRENRDLVMVLGNSLSGKSTLTEYMGNLELKSVLVTTETMEYMIFRNYINFQRFYSLTVVPQQIFDNKTNTMFYDCPSFSNFQNFSSAVISSYLLKKVIDLADRVKIVLTVSYPSVTSGESERDLLALLTQTARFINNITHFHRSIALMVTKVENRWLEEQNLVEDYTIREEIEEFLIDFKTNWILDQTEDYPFDNKYMYEKVLNLTDILLSIYSVDDNDLSVRNDSIDEDEINRIGLFRRPNIPAKDLSEVPILLDTKQRVLATIHNAIEFTTVRRDDFRYILGMDGIAMAYDVSNAMMELVTNKTALIADYFDKYFQNGGRPYHIYLTNVFFSRGYTIIKEMYMEIYNLTEVNRLPEILSHAAHLLSIDIPDEHFLNLKVNIDFLLFLENLAPDHLHVSVSEWIEPFWSIYESIRWSKIWYIFLNSLNKRLTSPDILTNKHKYDVEDVDDWGKGSRKRGTGIFINKFNYRIFIKNLEQYQLERWDDVAQYVPTANHLEDLNIILNMSFHGLDQVFCQDNYLKFSGRILQTSMIENQNCAPKVVTLFSSQSIEIDNDVDFRDDKKTLILVAPSIIVRGDRMLNLAGKDGEKLHGPITDVNFFGINGSDGVAGLPGNSSGHCVVICKTIMGDGKLDIITQGGRGADGQKGGLGGIGISRTSKNTTIKLKSKDEMPKLGEYDACTELHNRSESAGFKLMKCGTCGGSGGNGGKGGMSGPKGIVKYAAFSKKISNVNIKDTLRPGRDGEGGKQGENGRTTEYTFTADFDLTIDEMCGKALPESCPECALTVDGEAGTANIQDSIATDTEVPYPDLDQILHHYVKEMGDLINVAKMRKIFGL